MIDSFNPKIIDLNFIKRNKSKDSQSELIDNSVKGFYNYFSAPNIRNKVKHPLFLAVKFSACISLYFDSEIRNTQSYDQVVSHILNEF